MIWDYVQSTRQNLIPSTTHTTCVPNKLSLAQIPLFYSLFPSHITFKFTARISV